MLNSLTVRPQNAITENPDIIQLVDDWHASLSLYMQSGELSERSQESYQRGFSKFLVWCEVQGIQLVDADTIRSWIAHLREQEYKPNTINAWLAGVRAFNSWAIGARRLMIDPTEGVKSAKRTGTSKRHKRDVLTDNEVKRVLATCNASKPQGKRDKAILYLMAYTGVRTVEIQRARLEDLRTEGGRLVLYVQGKGQLESDDKVVIAADVAQDALYDWLTIRGDKPGPLFISLSNRSNGQAQSGRALRWIVKTAYRQAGITSKRKTAHSLRHTAITKAIQGGAKPIKVQSMARHKSLDTTMIYYHEIDRLEDPAEDYIRY